MASNFDFLLTYWPELARMGQAAEQCAHTDPNLCIQRLGLLAEGIAQEICVREGLNLPAQISQVDRLRELSAAQLLPPRVDVMFHFLRTARASALVDGLVEDPQQLLQMAYGLCAWLMEVYGDGNFIAVRYQTPQTQGLPAPEETGLVPVEEQVPVALQPVVTPASALTPQARWQKAAEAAEKLEEPVQAETQPEAKLDVALSQVISYALQQNGVPVVKSITITNMTQQDMENLELTVSASPAFMLPFSQHIGFLGAGKSLSIPRPKLVLDAQFLALTTEKITGVLSVTLSRNGQTLVQDHLETKVLAFDQWCGLGFYPELLTSFVTPNHPEVARLLARATEFLGEWTGDTAMDGYQSQDPNRVLHQAAAIYRAIKEQGIAYVVPPASFEEIGQRVRLCDMVMGQKLGTCLDLTLLYAACLEAAGLHPLLITTPGHIFSGVWLEKRMFPETVQDDAALITKRLASGVNEIAVLETTCVTSGNASSFDDARAAGEAHFSGAKSVEYIIDVRRARLSGVSPLPQRILTDSGWRVEHEVSFGEDTSSAPRKLDDTIQLDPNAQDDNIPKKVQWERKLLDLGMRNTLINLRLTKTQLPILTASLDVLENALADGSDFSILPRPGDIRLDGITFENMQDMGASEIIQAEFLNKRLRSVYTEAELGQTVKNLYRTAKTALEENGANTLYLALGMLRWYETARSTKPRYAPVILLPIEMVRKSAAQGYVIRLRDDEPQMNITLLEKLKQDFGIQIKGVDPLPVDEHGIDIRRVLTIIRKAVMEQPRWDVLEAASIGIFSFSQFVMWNDIRNRTDDLLRNKVVSSLMEGKLTWDANPLEMGQQVSEADVLLPMSADASQLYAIRTACQGESFVLHGPPGTGKSQTITSLIANALAQGKSVLFVAEKMAALDVVRKRLASIGIGPFCLELHSNKSKKKSVLEQLRQATEVTKNTKASQYAAKAEQLAVLRAQLDGYARQLHRVLPCGATLYTLISEYETLREAADLPPFDRSYIRTLDEAALEARVNAVQRMVAAGRAAGHPKNHPLTPVGCARYSQQLKAALPGAIEAYRREAANLAPHVQTLTQNGLGAVPQTYAELVGLSELARSLADWYDWPRAWSQATFPQQYLDGVVEMASHFQRAGELERQLLATFEPAFLTQDGQQLFDEYAKASGQWFLAKAMGTKKLVGKVSAFAKAPVNKDSLRGHLTALRDYQLENQAAQTALQTYGTDLGGCYTGKNTPWEQVAQMAQAARESAVALQNLTGSHELLHRMGGVPEYRESVFALRDALAPLTQAKNGLYDLLDIQELSDGDWLHAQEELCDTIAGHTDGLKEWVSFVSAAHEAEELGLSQVVQAYLDGTDHDALLPACRKALLLSLIGDAIDASEELNTFSGAVFNETLRQYTQADAQWREISQQEIYCRLAAKVPDFTKEAAHSSELGILQRFIKSGGRGTSIRKLFDQIPNLLPRLAPCMLMSPISAAQYLDPKREPFDIVVFDEASQLPTCKAVGVLARGKDAVIVGDPKQMPPTAFFATNTVDEDNLDIEDLESILDDCLALNMPQSHLLWHYRSRHESLIAFSNTRFYDNKLYTFPSVNDRESKVRLVHVDGVFQRGKSRSNRAEAEAVIAELQRRYQDPELCKLSVGVVTFNINQQNLIDDLLNEACAADPGLEKWVYESEEPVFIKNLENVQGDERDVILFSIGYGPDEKGKVYMNFGPLNREGGWRRLNVAVSRARCEMVVFSTLRPEQIDLSKTSATGVEALRGFLEYAQGRTLAMEETQTHATPDGIAQAISCALKEKGYDTDLSVGRSAYRIDVAVADPRNPEQYLLGILLDGTGYGTARTTRDRELAQIGVLKGLGWNVLRIWSMDWWDNRDKELNRILTTLEQLLTHKESQPESLPDREVSQPTCLPPAQPALLAAKAPVVSKSTAIYRPARLPECVLSAEEFLEPARQKEILKRFRKVLDAEAPVSQSVLIKRVLHSYGITRTGSRIQGYITTLLEKLNLKTTTRMNMVFCWREDQDPQTYSQFRTADSEETRRDIRDIPVQEIANAICAVLHEQISMTEEDLIRETAKKLGYNRLVGNIPATMAAGIGYAEYHAFIAPGPNGAYILTDTGTARV